MKKVVKIWRVLGFGWMIFSSQFFIGAPEVHAAAGAIKDNGTELTFDSVTSVGTYGWAMVPAATTGDRFGVLFKGLVNGNETSVALSLMPSGIIAANNAVLETCKRLGIIAMGNSEKWTFRLNLRQASGPFTVISGQGLFSVDITNNGTLCELELK